MLIDDGIVLKHVSVDSGFLKDWKVWLISQKIFDFIFTFAPILILGRIKAVADPEGWVRKVSHIVIGPDKCIIFVKANRLWENLKYVVVNEIS